MTDGYAGCETDSCSPPATVALGDRLAAAPANAVDIFTV